MYSLKTEALSYCTICNTEPDMFVLSLDEDGKTWVAEDFLEPSNIGKSEKWKESIDLMEQKRLELKR